MLDAPVSGGEPKAIDGTLSIMVGGAKADFDKCSRSSRCMGSSAVLTGASEPAMSPSWRIRSSLPSTSRRSPKRWCWPPRPASIPNLVYKAIRGGLAGSTVLDAKAPLMMDRKFNPGFRINLHIKDLGNVLETSHEVGVPLPHDRASWRSCRR